MLCVNKLKLLFKYMRNRFSSFQTKEIGDSYYWSISVEIDHLKHMMEHLLDSMTFAQ